MKNNQNILKKLENLLKPESTILVDLQKKIDDNTNTINKKEKSIAVKKEKITKINAEIDELNSENGLLVETFNSIKDKDLTLITTVLKLNLDVSKDLNKLLNQLPLQLEIRKNDINDLESAIKEDTEKLELAKNEIENLTDSLENAKINQKDLQELIKEAIGGSCLRTRAEVTDILKRLEFSPDDAYLAAKLIMFPEDELIPFFKDFKFADELDANEIYVDLDNIVDALKDDDTKKETSKPLENKEETSNNQETSNDDFAFLNDFDDIFSFDKEKEDNNFKDENTEEIIKEEKSKALDDDIFASKEEKQNDFQQKLEDETPISFEELKKMFNEDKTDVAKPQESAASNDSAKETISFNELQDKIHNIMNEIDKNCDSKEEPIIKEEEEIKDNNSSMEEFFEELNKNSADVKLIKPFVTDTLDIAKIKNLLKENNLNSNEISLIIYKNGLETYLKNIALLGEYGYKPNNMELQKNGIILSLISNENCRKNLKVLSDYKIDLKNANGHIAFDVLAVLPEELVRRIDLILENNQGDLITYNVNALAMNVDNILERINFCNEYNIPYTEEKNGVITFNSYIFNQSILEELVEKEVEINPNYQKLTNELGKIVDKSLCTILKDNLTDLFNIKLSDASKFDAYTRIEQKLESICVCKGNTYIIDGMSFSHQNTKRNLITLINNTDIKNDKEIIVASLFYNSYKSLDDAKSVLESL